MDSVLFQERTSEGVIVFIGGIIWVIYQIPGTHVSVFHLG